MKFMHSASFEISGTNYLIKSDPISVKNMEVEFQKIYQFVLGRGGSCREFEKYFDKKREFLESGYYNVFCFRSEFFLEGILINLSGITLNEKKYFVNPSRRNLDRDLRSEKGVCLSDLEDYDTYATKKIMGLVEQIPEFCNSGILNLSLEGAVRHLKKDAPEFYAVTGLSKEWKPELKLITIDQYEYEKEIENVKGTLFLSKNCLDYTKEDAISHFPGVYQKYPKIFDEVWSAKKKNKKLPPRKI